MICKYLIHYRYCETKNYFVFNNWYRYHQGRYCLYHWINTNFANCKTVDRVVSLCRINPKVKREKTNMPNMLPNMLVSCDEISLDLFYFFGVWVAPSWGIKIKIHNWNGFLMSNAKVTNLYITKTTLRNPLVFPHTCRWSPRDTTFLKCRLVF